MPIVFIAALIGSLAVHAAALFGPELDLSGPPETVLRLNAELRPLPAAAVLSPVAPSMPAVAKVPRPPKPPQLVSAPSDIVAEPVSLSEPDAEMLPVEPSTAKPPPPPAEPLLPANGVVRYALFKSSLGMQIGRTEQRWEFFADGTYRLLAITETTGIAALLKPVRIEQESRGRMVAGGLQPEHFTTLKNGRDANENAEFDWSTAEVRLSRDSSVQAISPGTQDALSFNYQLAHLGRLAEGRSLGVVTGKKYERYAVDSLGEEEIEVPAGHFRTLHLRVQTETVTEVWIALDQRGLPVKIRFTDKKGESFEQVATEIGM